MLILNLKTYPENTAENLNIKLEALVKLIADKPAVASHLFVAPSTLELLWAMRMYPQLQFVAQHLDSKPPGQTTGWLPIAQFKQVSGEFALINHSEHRLPMPDVISASQQAKQLDIKLVACCETIAEAKELLKVQPYAIAFETPELIGSGVSVTSRPQVVTEFVSLFQGSAVLPLVGAGVTTSVDIEQVIALGAKGAIVASAFAKAADPYAKALELVTPFC
jgi:triosephosphate isomerase